MGPKHKPHVDRCLNCETPTPDAFCSACGQEAVDASVSFHDQLADFFAEVLTFESRLPQTVKTLLRRPGELTRAYNRGQRVRYVSPLKMYLFASVAFFLVLSLSSFRKGFAIEVKSDDVERVLKDPTLPAFMVPHLRALLKSPEGFQNAVMDMISKGTMVLVPVHALFLKAIYWRPRRLYGEHIVFSLNVHAFGYIAFGIATLVGLVPSQQLSSAAGLLACGWTCAYLVLAARRAYGESALRSSFKMSFAGVGYLIALVLVIFLGAAAAFLVV